MRHVRFGLAVLAFAFARASLARADASPRAMPAPFVLPALEHDRLDVRVDSFVGRLTPLARDGASSAGALLRPSVEGSILVPRLLFVGLSWPVAAALPPDGGLAPGELARPSGVRRLVGNLEGHVRAVFPLPQSLLIGFVLAVVAPTARYDRSSQADRSAVDAALSFDPTNYPQLLADRVGLRLAGDLRIVRGPVVFQGRHGVDVLIDTRGRDVVKTAGRLLGHLGWLAGRDLEVSVEATQSYFFTSDDKVVGGGTPAAAFAERYRISDGHRSAFTIGPAVRRTFPGMELGAALVTNLHDPLSPAASGFVALNISLIGHVGPRGAVRVKGFD